MKMYAIKVSRAKMPGSCWGANNYYRIGLLRMDPLHKGEPTMISGRAKGVQEVVEVWERLYMGRNFPHGDCAASRAFQEAQEWIDMLT